MKSPLRLSPPQLLRRTIDWNEVTRLKTHSRPRNTRLHRLAATETEAVVIPDSFRPKLEIRKRNNQRGFQNL
jgi:hypothetical protein